MPFIWSHILFSWYWTYIFCRVGIKRRVSIDKTKKEVDNTTLIENLPLVSCSAASDQVLGHSSFGFQSFIILSCTWFIVWETILPLCFDLGWCAEAISKKEEPEPPQHQNFIVNEPKRVQISRILKKNLASEDEGLTHLHCPWFVCLQLLGVLFILCSYMMWASFVFSKKNSFFWFIGRWSFC